MSKKFELPQMSREMVEIRTDSFNADKYTIDLCWTTGATVRRRSWYDGPYDEELVVGASNVRLDRLNAGAPYLNSHDGYDLAGVIGSVVPGTARLVKGEGLATVQLSRRDDVAGIVQDIRDGVIRNNSVGYRVHAVEKLERDDGSVPLWRVIDWEPLELSAVPIPADPGAQMRAHKEKRSLYPCQVRHIMSEKIMGETGNAMARMRMQARELGLAV